MVYYYQADGFTVYMGRDKVENEPLVAHSAPDTLWFHADKFSSAHVYLEPNGQEIPASVLTQVAQFTKANSIKASKLGSAAVVYTPVANLHQDGSMDVGTVTFKNAKNVKRLTVDKNNAVVNAMVRTRTEVATAEFVAAQNTVKLEAQRSKKDLERQRAQAEKDQARAYQQQKQRSKDPYGDLFTDENMRGSDNWTMSGDYEEDFM